MTEIYVSTDIEADGPIPGVNSMMSFGSAAFTADGKLTSCFYATLLPLPGAVEDKETMKWWATQPKAYQEATRGQRPATFVMGDYVKWLKTLQGKPVFVGYPLPYDWMWIYWYLMKFAGESPFGFSHAVDIKSFAAAVLDTPIRETSKKTMPKEWFSPDIPHSHNALEDATEQGHLFIRMRAWRTNNLTKV